MRRLQGLIDLMLDVRTRLALPGNDFAWSSWPDQQAALAEIDALWAIGGFEFVLTSISLD